MRYIAALTLSLLMMAPPVLAASARTQQQGVGYGGVRVQLQPIMAPYRSKEGLRFEVVTIRIRLDAGEMERPGCYMIPYVHEAFVKYLYKAKLSKEDFSGPRREVLAKSLLDLAIKTTDRGVYAGLEIVDMDVTPFLEETPPDPQSATMSQQCG